MRAKGWEIAGSVRSADKAAGLRREGIEAVVFDGARPIDDAAAVLAGTTHALTSIPPGADGDPVLRHHERDLRRLASLRWCGYLGTTAVYGDRAGAWVDEGSVIQPLSERAKRRAAAEGWWLASGLPVHLFRLAGIYGPGRSAFDKLRAGDARRIDKPGQVFSRIHVDDIASVLEASITRPNPGAIYNVADDCPAAPGDVLAYAAELLGVPAPPAIPFDQADLSPMARSFYLDNRRVSNARLAAELGVGLRYPSYREGLRAILAAERAASA